MLRQYDVSGNRLTESTGERGKILVVIGPDDRERTLLQQQFYLDDYDLASTLDPDEIPRLDTTQDRLLLIWSIPESAAVSDVVELGVGTIGFAMVGDRIAFVRAGGEITFADREFRNVGDPLDVMFAFLLRTVRHFVGHLKVIRQISTELENKITVSMENRHLLQMFSLSESLVYYIDAIEGNTAVLNKLRNIGAQHGFAARHLETLDDIILENAQAARQANIFSSVINGLMDARGTIVNNNMNVLLKNLTLINIVFLPLNLIASIGGMSEWSMMTQGVHWAVSYSLFTIGMVAFGWATWLFMTKVVERGSARTNGTMRPPAKAATS